MNTISAHRMSRKPSNRYAPVALSILLIGAMLLGCNGQTNGTLNVIQSISLTPGQTPALNSTLFFLVSGLGTCKTLHVDWGDDLTDDFSNFDLTVHRQITHDYAGWDGGKTVTATGVDCLGRVSTRFTIPPGIYHLGFAQPGTMACNPLPGRPSLAMRSLVHIVTIPLTGPYSFGIDFGCPFNGCRYDANGKPGSVADSSYPFPGLLAFSLVLRVGTEVFQGGTDVRFTTSQSAPLEICVNDGNVTDNHGGYEIDISVDQLGPPAPP